MPNGSYDYRDLWLARPAVVATYLVLSLVAFLAVGFRTWSGYDFAAFSGPLSADRLAILKMLIYVFCFGGIGATSYSIYGFYRHVAKKDYDPAYLYWYLFRGPLGGVLGIVAYLLVQGGLLVFTDQAVQNIAGAPPTTFKTKAASATLAFLAGFSTNQFTDKLKDLAQTFFGRESHKGDSKD